MSASCVSSCGPYKLSHSKIQKLEIIIKKMEERGMKGDPRYSKARQLHQSLVSPQSGLGSADDRHPSPGPPLPSEPAGEESSPKIFQHSQLLQLRTQIMAFRMILKNQPLPPKIALAVAGTKATVAGSPPPDMSPPPTHSTAAGPQASIASFLASSSSQLSGTSTTAPGHSPTLTV